MLGASCKSSEGWEGTKRTFKMSPCVKGERGHFICPLAFTPTEQASRGEGDHERTFEISPPRHTPPLRRTGQQGIEAAGVTGHTKCLFRPTPSAIIPGWWQGWGHFNCPLQPTPLGNISNVLYNPPLLGHFKCPLQPTPPAQSVG